MPCTTVTPDHWPYPRWVAHRGAGTHAPENTLAAFRLGAAQGFQMFECDVKLSADQVPYLLHDDTLDRTTNATGPAAHWTWPQLATLDAAGWHGTGKLHEAPPRLDDIAAWCLAHGLYLNIELKPNPGQASETGRIVAQHAARLWGTAAGASTKAVAPPLLSSFSVEALRSAQDAAPQLPRACLLDHWPTDWERTVAELDCVALVGHHRLWTKDTVRHAKTLGLRLWAYTVNDPSTADQLLAWGLDGLITDAVFTFDPRQGATLR